MEYNEFIDFIYETLQELSPKQKDTWILEQAKLTPQSAYQDFILSLTGEKKILYMPTEMEIEEFCKKVQNGEIYVEYETHYCEFNSEGRYIDDWETWHNDPKSAFPFLDRTFRGCHDLLHLGEYELARKILDQICRLEFQVVEAENSEDFTDDSPFTVADAGREQKLSMSIYEIGYDWLEALLIDKGHDESLDFARGLLNVWQNELCSKLNPSDFDWLISEKLLDYMEKLLEEEIKKIDARVGNISYDSQFWRERYALEKEQARKQHLLLDIRRKCRKQKNEVEKQNKVSVLKASWKQIGELLHMLSYERYIDDQLEIDEVWNICRALIKRGRFEEEDWKLRKEILHEMVTHEYYDCYGCYDPIRELAEKLYITKEETLEFADLLNECGLYARQAADLYRQYGRNDKYVQYLETHLNKSSKEYVELIQFYHDSGNETRACEIAEQGLKKCKDDLTDLFAFLLQDAITCEDEERYKKFYASAKRRRMVDIVRLNKMISS